jgi:TldD protein
MKQIEELKIFDEKLTKKLNILAQNRIDYWDLRTAIETGTMVEFTDNKSKELSTHQRDDCGIRTFSNGGWGFVSLEKISRDSIEEGFKKAIKLAKLSESKTKTNYKLKKSDPIKDTFKLKVRRDLEDVDISNKIELLKYHENIANEFDRQIKNTHSLYYDSIRRNLFLNSFGSNIYQKESILRLISVVYAQKNGVIQKSVNSAGGFGGFELKETEKAKNISLKSAKEAVGLLDAKSPKGGKYTIIMDPELTGTFIHEAFGHAVEADHILNRESILEGRIGEKVALEKVNIIDDPRMGRGKELNLPYELYGSYMYDDEGVASQKTVIIENGILKNYLHNLETASRMNETSNGHGRASSATDTPQVRMGITYLSPGDWKLEDMIEDIKEGILCESFQYGYTDPTTGNFQFKCKLSYQIEDGEKTKMMRDVSLSGMTLEVLNKITAIGKNLNYSDGMCGKGGQRVRVCDGGPYIRVKNMTIGGLN